MKASIKKRLTLGTTLTMQSCMITNPYKSLEIFNQYADDSAKKILEEHVKD